MVMIKRYSLQKDQEFVNIMDNLHYDRVKFLYNKPLVSQEEALRHSWSESDKSMNINIEVNF